MFNSVLSSNSSSSILLSSLSFLSSLYNLFLWIFLSWSLWFFSRACCWTTNCHSSLPFWPRLLPISNNLSIRSSIHTFPLTAQLKMFPQPPPQKCSSCSLSTGHMSFLACGWTMQRVLPGFWRCAKPPHWRGEMKGSMLQQALSPHPVNLHATHNTAGGKIKPRQVSKMSLSYQVGEHQTWVCSTVTEKSATQTSTQQIGSTRPSHT